MSSPRVYLVVDPNFGSRAIALAREGHVWLLESPENCAAAERGWGSEERDAITLFRRLNDETPNDSAKRILDTLLDHHEDLGRLRIYGVRLTPDFRTAILDQGAVNLAEEQDYLECDF